MPLYEYRDPATGRTIERLHSMHDVIPEAIDEGGIRYERVFGNFRTIVKAGEAVNYPGQRLPISRSLPDDTRGGGTIKSYKGHKVREYKDGTRTTLGGQWIIETNAQRQRAAELTGSKWEKS